MKRILLVVMILTGIVLSGCGGSASKNSPAITISNVWARAAVVVSANAAGQGQMAKATETQGAMATPSGAISGMSGTNSAIFMVIQNKGGVADRLIKAESDVANVVEIHQTEMNGDIMSMHPVDGIDVPANGQVELKSGGYHVMLIGLKHDLVAGDKVQATLVFEKSGKMTIEAEVRNP